MSCFKNTTQCDDLKGYCLSLCNQGCECYNSCIENNDNIHGKCSGSRDPIIAVYCVIPLMTLLIFMLFFGIAYGFYKLKMYRTCKTFLFFLSVYVFILFFAIFGWNVYIFAICNQKCERDYVHDTPKHIFYIIYSSMTMGMNDGIPQNIPTVSIPLEKTFPQNIPTVSVPLETTFPLDIDLETLCPVCYKKIDLCVLGCRHVICKQCLFMLPTPRSCTQCRKNIDLELIRICIRICKSEETSIV